MLDRRSFVSSIAATGLVTSLSQGASARPRRKIRVGALNVGEMTFWPIWADILSPKGKFGGNLLNMEITHCWDINPKLAAEFAGKYDCLAVQKYDGMIGKVDAIAFGGLYEVPWQHLLAKPYIEAGIPTYLSRPVSFRLRDIDFILNLAAKHSTPLMATSVAEHFSQALYLKERLKNVGTIKAVHGIGWSDEYAGHFHVQWFILRVLGYDVDKVSLLTDDDWHATYLQETMLFKGRDGQPPYLASMQAITKDHYVYLNVIGDKGTESTSADRNLDESETLYSYFAPQLLDMQRTFEGTNYQPFEVIRKKTQIFLAGYYSHLEKGGSLVPVNSVPTDWSARPFKPGLIDEAMFRL